LILLSADWRDQAISPGPLAQHHAQLLESESSPDYSLQRTGYCAACHAAAERSASSWTVSLAGFHGGGPDQSQRCMECHHKTIAADFALAAHNVPAGTLSNLTTSGKNASAVGVACAACHREHQGAKFDLTAMSDAACQSCHQQRYKSFSSDHPDFGQWPYVRRTRIVFNHASHHAKHFAEKKRSFDCRTCHLDDSAGAVQLLANYETACASCHDEKIATSVAKGVPYIVLPTLDVDALKDAGHDIGSWPNEVSGDFDGGLPPAMKLLLAADPNAAQAIGVLGADFDFFDVDPDDPKHLQATATIAEATKKLLADLGGSGPAAMRERLQLVLGRDIPNSQFNMLAGLPTETVGSAAKSWLPDTAAVGMLSTHGGVSTLENASNMPKPPGGEGMAPIRATAIRFDQVGTWTRDDNAFSIRYRPAAHADPVLAGWLELLAATPDLDKRPLARAMFKELSNPAAAGLCASCHSVERTSGGQLSINWRTHDRTTAARSLTKFSHGPHLLLPQLADCTSCHEIDDSADTTTSYASDDPHAFVSEFVPISKQHCVRCHTATAAGDSCQKCHNYHLDEIEHWRLDAISIRGLKRVDSSTSPAGGEDAPAR
jgi:hypothetical protein